MLRPEDIVQVNGPTVDIYEPDWAAESRYLPDVIYSVQLTNGTIVTSPERFPNELRSRPKDL